MMVKYYTIVSLLICAALTAAVNMDEDGGEVPVPPSVLLVLLDDIGTDRLSIYNEGLNTATTPVINNIASSGCLIFDNFWTNPTCSPTRAAINTGLHGIHSGVGSNPGNNGNAPLDTTIDTIADYLNDTYATAFIGKWHLANQAAGLNHPNECGWELFSGPMGNLQNYYSWQKVTNGIQSSESDYATSVNVDDVIRFYSLTSEPSFVFLSFNGIHKPWHEPPSDLHTVQNLPPDPNDDPIAYVNAMTEAIDTELGRLLPHLPSNTYVILLGDNGGHTDTIAPPQIPGHSKGTMYEGGVRVPMLIAGPGIVQGNVPYVFGAVDILPTVLDICGIDPQGASLDGVSMYPCFSDPNYKGQRYVYSERFRPNGVNNPSYNLRLRAARGQKYKLIRVQGSPDEFYDLSVDPYEQNNLLLSPPLDPDAQDEFDLLDLYIESI